MSVNIKEGYWFIPMAPAFKKEYGRVRLPFPKRLEGKKLKEVRINYKYDARFFEVEYIIEQESYTSQSSFLDQDKLPVYNADNPKEHKFSGKRIKRGLYSKEKLILNANSNGAANILQKSNHNLDFQRVSSGLLLNRPLRISSLRILVYANAWAG